MTLDELTTPLTTDEVKENIYASMAAQGVDTTTWKPGAVVRTIIAGVAIIVHALSVLIAAIAKSGFLDLAESAWLTLVARYVYGVERLMGSFATSTVTVDNGGGGVYSGEAGDLVFVCSANGKTYRNTASFSIAANESGVEIPVQAVEIGTASNAAEDAIDDFETPLTGVSVVGSTSASGADVEGDAALRLRCREKLATLSPNGPRAAYAYMARSAKLDGVAIGVTRVRLIADGNGNVDVYVATANGDVDGTVGDLTSKLGVIDNDIQTKVVPEGVTAVTHSATAHPIDVTYEVWVRDTITRTEDQLTADIQDEVNAFLGGVPIGGDRISGESTGRVYASAIEGVIAEEIKGDEIVSPLVKLVMTAPTDDVDIAATGAPKAGSVVCTAVHVVTGGVL